MTITVTADDIALADFADPRKDPICVACRRMGFAHVSVAGGTIKLQLGRWDAPVVYELPQVARDFVALWDNPNREKFGIEPFTFEV